MAERPEPTPEAVPSSRERVVIIGAGVIGLSSALCLQLQGFEVTIVARDFPGPFETIDSESQINYTSPWGGAHNRWAPPTNAQEEREHLYAISTFSHMEELERTKESPAAGLTFMKGIEYLETPSQAYRDLTEAKAATLGLKDFRLLAREELPRDVEWGCEYWTYCVNPMVYCSYLLRRFSHAGGKILKRDLREPSEIFAMSKFKDVKTVVNCSGYGFGDPKMFPTRGQTCLVANDCDATVTRQNKDGSWTFCVPRGYHGGTVIGGTKDIGDWSPEPSESVRNQLLSKFKATYPQILAGGNHFRVLRDIVGRRPTRQGGLRLEVETVSGDKTIIHAYGLGGRGYELSWGVAEEVLKMVRG